MSNWLSDFKNNNPLIIAGPCSAETENQILDIALQLKDSKVSIFRAGIWKPRTRPGGFEGVGEIGLPWLEKARAKTGLLMGVEVANANHVKLALKYNIDLLWIGARTSVNPFAVQEIADALQNTDKIILIKNPVNPDLSLWIGGVERLQNANIKKLGIVHRGFSTYEKTKYRNIPEWQIAIEIKNKFPHLPLICDPSHISGSRDRIAEVSQQSLDLNYNGLMIETHNDPEHAWSDVKQQITPDKLKQIIDNLILRKITDETLDYTIEIENLRSKIDYFDAKIIEVIGNRMLEVDKIGVLKKEKNVAILQNQRWNLIKQNMISEGVKIGLSEEFILSLFKALHQESINHQTKIMK